MQVRLLSGADAQAFWNLRLEALQTDARAFASSVDEHRTLTVETMAQRLNAVEQGDFVLGAFDGVKLIGIAGFHRDRRPKTAHKGMIWGVYVTPAHRGKRISRLLISTLLERVKTYSGVEQVNLQVASTQTAAERLYRSVGFEAWGREARALKIGDEYVDEYFMTLRLRR